MSVQGNCLPAETLLSALNSGHEARWARALAICDALGDGESADANPEYDGNLRGAAAICDSLFAFPSKSLDDLRAKVAIVRREYSGNDGAGILFQTKDTRGVGDVVASLLDDLLALV